MSDVAWYLQTRGIILVVPLFVLTAMSLLFGMYLNVRRLVRSDTDSTDEDQT